MEEFIVRMVAIEEIEDTNTFVIVLYESPTGEGARLELQRALSCEGFGEQDRQNDMDTYCACTHTGACHYGGIEWYECDDRALLIKLRPEAAFALGVSDGFRLGLDIDSASIANLRTALPRVLAEVQEKPSIQGVKIPEEWKP